MDHTRSGNSILSRRSSVFLIRSLLRGSPVTRLISATTTRRLPSARSISPCEDGQSAAGVILSKSARRRGYLHTRWIGCHDDISDVLRKGKKCIFNCQTLIRRSFRVKHVFPSSRRLFIEATDFDSASIPMSNICQVEMDLHKNETSSVISSYFSQYSS